MELLLKVKNTFDKQQNNYAIILFAKLQEKLELAIYFCNSDCFLSFYENIIKN
jgi:hypothetical protein